MMVKDYDTCTDEELIARLRAGEREITDYLIDKYKSLVRTRARALYLVGSGIVPAPEASAAEQLRLVKRTGFRARAAPGGRGDTGGDYDQPGKRNRHA